MDTAVWAAKTLVDPGSNAKTTAMAAASMATLGLFAASVYLFIHISVWPTHFLRRHRILHRGGADDDDKANKAAGERIGDAYAFHGIWHALLAYLCWKHAAADPWRKRGHLAMREHCLVVAALCALFGMNYLRMARHQGHGAFGPGAASAGAVCTLGTAALFASLALALYMTA